uniref:Uncharacterized protein n=1 Tax=Tetranychus urticae TaxID=32264 RepID=T1K2Z6_TETUR
MDSRFLNFTTWYMTDMSMTLNRSHLNWRYRSFNEYFRFLSGRSKDSRHGNGESE